MDHPDPEVEALIDAAHHHPVITAINPGDRYTGSLGEVGGGHLQAYGVMVLLKGGDVTADGDTLSIIDGDKVDTYTRRGAR